MIRPARPSDLPELTSLVIKVAKTQYPELRPKPEDLRSMVVGCVSSPSAFVQVSLDGNAGVVGGLIAFSEKGAWFERSFCNLGFLYTTVPGDGAAMLRAFRQWIERRPAIKAVQIIVDFAQPERVGKLLERIGFPRRGAVHGIVR